MLYELPSRWEKLGQRGCLVAATCGNGHVTLFLTNVQVGWHVYGLIIRNIAY